MHKKAGFILLISASAAALAATSIGPIKPVNQVRAPTASALPVAAVSQPAFTPAPTLAPPSSAIAGSVARWRSLQQSDALPFSAYSSFLLGHRGWPAESALRNRAEARLSREDPAPGDVIAFFTAYPPRTATGHAGHALALQASGRVAEARAAAQRAWTTGAIGPALEQRLLGTFASAFTPDLHDQRLDALLSNGDTQSAVRALAWASPQRRPIYEARLALQTRAPDAPSRVAALGGLGSGDSGLLIDRANYMRSTGNSIGARELLARRPALTTRPANPEKFMESMVTIARAAAADRQWGLAYDIASRVTDIFPQGTDISRQSFGERDEYTNLTWLAGSAALRTGRNADAARMFDLYGRAAQSTQTRAKGFYWAARAATAAGQAQQANTWLNLAAGSPDQFYSQLALERLGRPLLPPPASPFATPQERDNVAARPLAQAIRYLGTIGARDDQTTFIRAFAQQLQNDRERVAATEFARGIGRLDMGVWAAREARSNGSTFYSRSAFPEVAIPPAYRANAPLAHGIMRQESSFERSAVSHAGARGMMQLMPATAAQEARSLDLPFSQARLTEDPDYNVLLGSHHLQRLMREWGNSPVLVAAAYNAGSGNVRRWVRERGDPRVPGTDILLWIEDIPFSETRNYVQRVIENTMVYDRMNPSVGRSNGRVSYYLGRNAAP